MKSRTFEGLVMFKTTPNHFLVSQTMTQATRSSPNLFCKLKIARKTDLFQGSGSDLTVTVTMRVMKLSLSKTAS